MADNDRYNETVNPQHLYRNSFNSHPRSGTNRTTPGSSFGSVRTTPISLDDHSEFSPGSPGQRSPSFFLDLLHSEARNGWQPYSRRETPHPLLSALRQPAAMFPNRRSNGYVDLTQDSSPITAAPQRGPIKRNAAMESSPEAEAGPSTKRVKQNDGSSAPAKIEKPVEEVDLVDENNPLDSTLKKQREEQVKSQLPPTEKPLRLSNLTCVICMDTPKDLTATACGHLFCHSCLMEALIAGENRSGAGEPKRSQCPVCRKAISRNKAQDIIPLLMKKGLSTQPRRPRSEDVTA